MFLWNDSPKKVCWLYFREATNPGKPGKHGNSGIVLFSPGKPEFFAFLGSYPGKPLKDSFLKNFVWLFLRWNHHFSKYFGVKVGKSKWRDLFLKIGIPCFMSLFCHVNCLIRLFHTDLYVIKTNNICFWTYLVTSPSGPPLRKK